MDDELKLSLEKYIRDKKLLNLDRQRLILFLPDAVASELHYNGPYRAKERYPEYSEVFNEFIKEIEC
jgi:hypothetical protein